MHKSERIELQLFQTLDSTKHLSLRRSAILKVMQEEKAQTALIVPYLANRYNISGEVTLKSLEVAQKNILYSDIKKKCRHEILYRAKCNEIVDLEESSLWLDKGNVRARDEAYLCLLQNRWRWRSRSRVSGSTSGW